MGAARPPIPPGARIDAGDYDAAAGLLADLDPYPAEDPSDWRIAWDHGLRGLARTCLAAGDRPGAIAALAGVPGTSSHHAAAQIAAGCEPNARALRFGLERSYRALARLTPEEDRRIELVDMANAIRPRTLT